MSKSFLLINHKSLGPAVVLDKDSDGVLSAAFSGKTGRKSILESHPFTEKWNLPLTDFIKYELFEYIFDDFTKEKAERYINEDHIQLVDIGDDIINARVKGTHTYQVSISLRNSRITFTCDCPVSGLCKHIYAVCAYIFKTKFHQPRRNDSQTKQESKKDNTLQTTLSSYFYFQRNNFDFTSFYKIYDYIVSHLDNLEQHLEIINQFYNRAQYQLRVMVLLLYPLSLDSKINAEFSKILAETQQNDISILLSAINNFKESSSYRRVIELPWYKTAIEYLNAYFNQDLHFYIERNIRYGFESDYYLVNIIRYIEKYDLNIGDVTSLNSSSSFRNYMFVIRSKINNEVYHKENVRYLFIFTMNESELKDKSIPIEVLLKYAGEGVNAEKVIPILTARFNEIDVDQHQLLASLLCRYMFFSLTEKMKYEEDYLSLANKLPNNSYLIELINNQRRKKVR